MSEATRIAGLDGLRAVAALAVFGVHFNQVVELDAEIGPLSLYRLLANGEHGVALFFGLSGFLLSLPFWRAMLDGASFPSLRSYALRRATRILPAYYVCLTVLVLWSGLWRVPGAALDILLHATFVFNFAEFSILSINAPFWTLAVEVQFYLLLPLIFMLLWRKTPAAAIAGMVTLGVASYAGHYWLLGAVTGVIEWPLDPGLIWIRPYGAVLNHSLLGHLPHFLLGMIAGRIFLYLRPERGGKPPPWQAAELAFWSVGLAVFLLLATELGDAVQVSRGRYGLPLIPLLITVVILLTPFTRFARALLDSLPLRGLGALSYGIYIYHLPCLNGLDRFLREQQVDAAQHPLLFGTAALLITLAVASLSYLAVERPLLRRAHRAERR